MEIGCCEAEVQRAWKRAGQYYAGVNGCSWTLFRPPGAAMKSCCAAAGTWGWCRRIAQQMS